MKHKRWIALLLAAVLAVTALSVTACAAESADAEPEAAAEETTEPACGGRHGGHGKHRGTQETGEFADGAAEDSGLRHGGHGKHGSRQKVEEPENAVGKDAAKAAALADAGLTAEQVGKVRARLSQTEDGVVLYKVRFTFDGQRYSYRIDALTGEILEKSVNAVTEEHTRGTTETETT